MGNIREKATDHCLAFIQTHRNFKTIYLKYAEMSDEVNRLVALSQHENRPLDEEEYGEYEYYDVYSKLLATLIADNALQNKGFSKDEEGYWL